VSRRLAGYAAAGVLACFACTSATDPAPPNLLLITVDTLRPDYLSMNGYDRATTPEIDSLLAEGFYYEQAVAPVPRTTPALAALMTGAYPRTNGVRTLTGRVADDVETLAGVLHARGYQTLAVVTNQVMNRDRGLDRGFDVYDFAADTRAAAATTDAALGYFDGLRPGAPVFIWAHYIDPHVPYHSDPRIAEAFDPDYTGRYRLRFGRSGSAGQGGEHRAFPQDLPKGVATHRNPLDAATNAHIRRLYAADIRSLDAQVGRLVAAAREQIAGEWLVVFTSDHGESLGEHDFYWDHGDYVYNAGTRVPLGIVLPISHPLRGSGRCRGWVSLVDIAPTLFDLLGYEPPDTMRAQLSGRTLSACMRGEALSESPVFAESGHSYYFTEVERRQRNDVAGRFRAVFQGDWKLIWTPFADDADAWELYDVAADPHETSNLYRPDHPAVAELAPQLTAWAAGSRGAETRSTLSPKDEALLRELGYLE